MKELLAEESLLLNWIDSDFTYANNRLASHYGIEGTFREQPRLVSFPEGQSPGRRRG